MWLGLGRLYLRIGLLSIGHGRAVAAHPGRIRGSVCLCVFAIRIAVVVMAGRSKADLPPATTTTSTRGHEGEVGLCLFGRDRIQPVFVICATDPQLKMCGV